MILAELNLGQTIVANAAGAFFVAVLAGLGVGYVAHHWEKSRQIAEQRHQDRLNERELHHQKFMNDAEHEHQRWLREANEAQAVSLQTRDLEHQTRASLRECYGLLLSAQRRSRESSLALSRTPRLESAQVEAATALGIFMDAYHRLNLDASRDMWKEARGLRHVLEDLLKAAEAGNHAASEELVEVARDARQNLERSFRERLHHEALQDRKDLGRYDKALRP